MSGALYKSVDVRERRALIKQRFGMAEAKAMCPFAITDFFDESVPDPCPACHGPGLKVTADRFSCGTCGVSGDSVTWVMYRRSVHTGRAIGLIETWMEGRS